MECVSVFDSFFITYFNFDYCFCWLLLKFSLFFWKRAGQEKKTKIELRPLQVNTVKFQAGPRWIPRNKPVREMFAAKGVKKIKKNKCWKTAKLNFLPTKRKKITLLIKIIVLHQPSGLQLWLKKRRWRGLAFLWDDLFSSFWPSVNGQSCRQVVEGKMFSHTRQGLPISSLRSRLWWERKLGYLENPLSKVKIDLN